MSETQSATGCPAEVPSLCSRRHWSIYWLLILLAGAAMTSSILRVQNLNTRGESPFFSANDRSRWCTIYSLVHFGTYEIDRVIERDSPIHWDTIDKVAHLGRDGRMHQYSSKPALLPTLLAGEYWLVRFCTGWDLDSAPLSVARTMLLISNMLPLLAMLWCLAAILERMPLNDWVRYFVMACGGFATFLSTFSVTINNHIPAAVATMATIYFVDSLFRGLSRRPYLTYVAAGLTAGFAAANELPALALVAAVFLLLATRSPLSTLLGFLPGFGLVAAAFFTSNYLAHGLWEVAYAHRQDGPVIETFRGDFEAELDSGYLPRSFESAARRWCEEQGWPPPAAPAVELGTWMGQSETLAGRWVIRDPISQIQFAITEEPEGTFLLREWDNWYDFPGSYWSADVGKRSDVDRGERSPWRYAFHMSLGHHGIISLTPIWFFAAAGMLVLMFDWRYRLRWLGGLTVGLTAIVFLFYVTREAHDRNYGGWTSGLRWMFWLIPLWLVAMAPVVQWLARNRRGRTLALILMFFSILSAGYSVTNPWVHPWLYVVWDWTGLPR